MATLGTRTVLDVTRDGTPAVSTYPTTHEVLIAMEPHGVRLKLTDEQAKTLLSHLLRTYECVVA